MIVVGLRDFAYAPQMADSVSSAQARRIALAAQGFGKRSAAPAGVRQIHRLIARLGLLQLDSVNVFERSHYLPLFSRLGRYDKADLDRLTFSGKARYTEYWAHAASIIPIDDWPLWRWKMRELRERSENNPKSWIHANRSMLDWLRAELRDKGPLPASRIEHRANRRKGGWWNWSDVKLGLEYLFGWGEVVAAGRCNFERIYGLAEQVLPPEIFSREIDKRAAVRQLLARAAKAHGIGVLEDLADYYRIKKTVARPLIGELVEEGELLPVTVPEWRQQAYLHRESLAPRRIETSALLSPFDPVVWERDRALRLFGFHYRIEIYTPAHKRIYGYYTLPILIDDAIVGRIDLKSDRRNRTLCVQSAWREPHAPAGIAQRIAPLLHEARAWQGLDRIEAGGKGDLARAIAAELGLKVRRTRAASSPRP